MLKKKVIGIVLTQKMADERYVKKDEPTPTVGITVTPSSVNKDEATTMTIQVTSSQTSSNVKVKRNGTEVQGSYAEGTVWNFTDTFTPTAEGTVTYTAEVVIGSETKTASTTITVVTPAPPQPAIPAYIGAGVSVSAVVANPASTRDDYGEGRQSYTVQAAADDTLYIILPEGTPFVNATAGGTGIVFEIETTETVEGLTYDVRGSQHLEAGNYDITVQYT